MTERRTLHLLAAALLAGACFSPEGGTTAAESTGAPTTTTAATTTDGGSSTATGDPSGEAASSVAADPTTAGVTTEASTGTTASADDTSSTGTASTAGSSCQDGVVDLFEECDNGPDVAGDGCSADCTRDALFMFVSSQLYAASEFEGAPAADLRCDELAQSSSWPALPRNGYVAWLSDSRGSAASRLEDGDLPYILPNGPTVALSSAALEASMLLAPVDHDEHGTPVVAAGAACSNPDNIVWTGTHPDGNLAAELHCEDWTANSADETGLAGLTSAMDELWTDACTPLCVDNFKARIYCIEQPPP